MTLIKLKRKYRLGHSTIKQSGNFLADVTRSKKSAGAYRGRTGPICCGPNCPSGRKKGRVWKR